MKKKRSEETQTLRALVKIDRCTQFLVTVVTDPQTHKQTQTNPQTGPITIHCAAKLSAQCNDETTRPRKSLMITLAVSI